MADHTLIDQPTGRPTRKVMAGSAGGGVGSILGIIIGGIMADTIVPFAEYKTELQMLITMVTSYAGAFVAGYMIRDRIV